VKPRAGLTLTLSVDALSLLDRYRLAEHLTHLKEYLLLGKCDFVQALIVVSRCLGIGPPSGIPPLGRCFCWPPIFVASQQASWEYPALSLLSYMG